jgi:hypothetical protein
VRPCFLQFVIEDRRDRHDRFKVFRPVFRTPDSTRYQREKCCERHGLYAISELRYKMATHRKIHEYICKRYVQNMSTENRSAVKPTLRTARSQHLLVTTVTKSSLAPSSGKKMLRTARSQHLLGLRTARSQHLLGSKCEPLVRNNFRETNAANRSFESNLWETNGARNDQSLKFHITLFFGWDFDVVLRLLSYLSWRGSAGSRRAYTHKEAMCNLWIRDIYIIIFINSICIK